MNFKFYAGVFALFSASLLALMACSGESVSSVDDKLSNESHNLSSGSKVKFLSSSSSFPLSYAESKVKPSGTYDCSKYNCVMTDSLNQEFLEEGKYGEFLDERDGQVYKTIQMGERIWMAQNLNFQTNVSCYCYKDDEMKCAKYGCLYSWIQAVDYKGMFGSNGVGCGNSKRCSPELNEPVQGICPSGWHLPSLEEYKILRDSRVGNEGSMNWSVLYGGRGIQNDYQFEKSYGYFWTASERSSNSAYYIIATKNLEYLRVFPDNSQSFLECTKNCLHSVRCVKN